MTVARPGAAVLRWLLASDEVRKPVPHDRQRRGIPHALLLATGKGTADVCGTVEIARNGKPVEELTLT